MVVNSRRRFLVRVLGAAAGQEFSRAAPSRHVPVLVYHRFASAVADGMTVRFETFASHLGLLQARACDVVPLADVVAWRRGELPDLPERAVAMTADDGHRSQFEHMAPMLRPLGWPVTLFVYPSAISNADYAMRWEQLAALKATGQFSIESHTYWHPNFLRERKRLPESEFRRFAADQLVRSKERLAQRLGGSVSMLAWPFGLSDEPLQEQARDAGYRAAVSLGNRSVVRTDLLYALPRFLVTDSFGQRQLDRVLAAAFGTS